MWLLSSKDSLLMKDFIGSKTKDFFLKIPSAKNLARQNETARAVQFQEVGLHFTTDVKAESNERRIQAFFVILSGPPPRFDYQQVALLLVMFLPKGKLSLSKPVAMYFYFKTHRFTNPFTIRLPFIASFLRISKKYFPEFRWLIFR